MIALILIAIGFLVGTFLALPVLLPEIRTRAQYRSAFRNRTRIIFAVLTLLILFGGLSWGMSQFYTGFANCVTTSTLYGEQSFATINCDTDNELQAVSYELWLRTMLPPATRDTCIFGAATCDLISEYQVFADESPMNSNSTYWGFIAAVIIGVAVNWAVVSFFTQPKKKDMEIT
jgi:hypothetical protein